VEPIGQFERLGGGLAEPTAGIDDALFAVDAGPVGDSRP